MNPEDQLIVLRGLEGNDRGGQLTASQEFLSPYLDLLTTVWGVVWFVTLAIVLVRFIIAPLVRRKQTPAAQ